MPHLKPLFFSIFIPVISSLNCHAALTVYGRDSTITIAPFNLGYVMGAGGGSPGDTVVNESVVSDTADLNVSGNLFYGPDSFNRTNTGTYQGVQDFKVSSITVGADLSSASSVAGNASPSSRVQNEIDTFLLSTLTVEANLTLSYSGSSQNVGADDSVRLFVDQVDAAGDPPVSGGRVFSLSTYVILNGLDSQNGSFTTSFTLDAGQRYRIRAEGSADSVISGNESSQLNYLLTIPEPSTTLLVALAGGIFIRHRKR